MKPHSATEIGKEIFLQALQFKINMNKERVSLKFSICGHDYFVDLDSNTMKDPQGAHKAWLNIFKEFELDLDKGVEQRNKLILGPEDVIQS